MASRSSDRVARYALVLGLLAHGGCKNPGAALEPPAHEDAANPDAAVPDYRPSTDVFEVSAFEGEILDDSVHQHGGHAGHGRPSGHEQGGSGHEQGADDGKASTPGHGAHGDHADHTEHASRAGDERESPEGSP